jgi:hypothetical protein
MSRDGHKRSASNYTMFHFKVRGVPFGLYRWRRNLTDGFVMRVGPLGHVQLQCYRMRIMGGMKRRDGRRGKHGIALHFWGVAGRRRKRGIDIGVIL